MKGIGYRLYSSPEGQNDGEITITTPATNTIIPKSYPIIIEWDYTKEKGIIDKVDIYWQTVGSNDWNLIEKGTENYQYWYWNIDSDFTDYKQPKIIYEEDSSISTGRITESSFSVMNEGYFMANNYDSSMWISLEMRDDSNKVYYTGDTSIYINIVGYKVDSTNPVWIDPDSSIIFPGTVDYKQIDLLVANSVNNDVYGRSEDLFIV
jgi:hypothetical protein